MRNEELLEEFFLVKNHDPKTQKAYLRSINKYSKFHGLTMEELIEEAETEEENGVSSHLFHPSNSSIPLL